MANECSHNHTHKDIVELKKVIPDDDTFIASATFFKALSDPTRTKIIWALAQSELCVSCLTALLDMTQSAISHQLSGLKKDKMVKSRKQGKEVFYSLADEHIRNMLIAGIDHTKE